jgi:hypothetical protein
VLGKASLSVSFGDELERVSGLQAYLCPNHHVFLMVPEQPEPEVSERCA